MAKTGSRVHRTMSPTHVGQRRAVRNSPWVGVSPVQRGGNEFLAMLGHRLRNPLAPIRSAVTILRMHERASEHAESGSATLVTTSDPHRFTDPRPAIGAGDDRVAKRSYDRFRILLTEKLARSSMLRSLGWVAGGNMKHKSSNAAIRSCGSGAVRGNGIADDRNFDGQSLLPDVIAALMALSLPPDKHELIPKLTGFVSACRGVSEHRGKVWADLTQAEGNIVAHKVGVIAREILGTGRAGEIREPRVERGRGSRGVARRPDARVPHRRTAEMQHSGGETVRTARSMA